MERKKIDVDVVKDVLLLVLTARPGDNFVQSISRQYEERGSLSKKQLEGLHGKASRIESVSVAKLATLEAIIKKKPTRERAAASVTAEPLFAKDEAAGAMIANVLAKYPQHKRVLFFKAKYDNNEVLNSTELSELKKFEKMVK
jgi:hypothetical protein